MKKASSSPQRANPDPQDDLPEEIDELVDDLAQQNVLPSHRGAISEPDDTLSGGLDASGRWDEPIGDRGHRVSRPPLEDETSDAERLVSNGLDEADEELRELEDDTDEREEDESDEEDD